ncbi:MAG TPA: NUDIX domain-containing protein [Streptosporangiaceae bacterium]|nr:NUDIX domain-containing protein [Streptosporangiaceae bacterium]
MHDRPIDASTRQEAWANGAYHRLTQIVLRDEEGNLLLQKRSARKSLYPGRWTNAASGHVDEGETYEIAAARELTEEIGVSIPLKVIGKLLLQTRSGDKIINQFISVFEGCVLRSTEFKLHSEEVSEIRWVTLEELKERIVDSADEFTPAMVKTTRELYM